MSRFLLALLLAIAASFSAPLAAADPDWDAVDALLAEYEPDAPGVSIAVSIGGDIVYRRAVGTADLAHDVPIDADTRFAIASISKQFTAFAIHSLAHEGKLSLDQDVRDFVPELETRALPVTIRHLLDHRGGLREANSLLPLTGRREDAPFTQEASTDLILRDRGQNFAAGERQEYSNSGYQLLALVVERVSGQSFNDYLQSRVFAPLGMERSFVRTDPRAVIEDFASAYTPSGDGFAYEPLLATTTGSTGIVSDPKDLLAWAHALNHAAIGADGVVAALDARSEGVDGVAVSGNGQELRAYRGIDTYSHGGTAGAYRSFLLRIPEADLAIAVMANRSDFQKAAFAFRVADAVLGDRLDPVSTLDATPESAAQLDRYVGDYRLFAGLVFSIRRDGDALTFATFGKEDAFALPQFGPGRFMLNPKTDLHITFEDFDGARASHLRWRVGEEGYLLAPRVAMDPVPTDPLDLSAVAGTYYSDTLQQAVTLSERDGALWLRLGSGEEAQYERYQPDTFRPVGTAAVMRIELGRDDEGSFTHLLLSAALADDLVYRRVEAE